MNYRFTHFIPLLAIAGACIAMAQAPGSATKSGSSAQSGPSAPPPGGAMRGPSPSLTPQDFVTKAALDGMTEVQLAQMATSQSQSADVKQFAQQMMTDHGKVDAELATIAQGKNLEIPTSLDAEHQGKVRALSTKSGAAFDKAYASEMATAHTKAIALFTRAGNSSDSDIAAFAKKTLPTLEMHSQMAQNLSAKTGGQ